MVWSQVISGYDILVHRHSYGDVALVLGPLAVAVGVLLELEEGPHAPDQAVLSYL